MRKGCSMLAVEGLNAWWGHAQALFDVRLQVGEAHQQCRQVDGVEAAAVLLVQLLQLRQNAKLKLKLREMRYQISWRNLNL